MKQIRSYANLWNEQLKESVIGCRGFVKQEMMKARERRRFSSHQSKAEKKPLSLNEYIEFFLIDASSDFYKPFRGEQDVLDAFRMEWQEVTASCPLEDAALEKAIQIMTEDIEETIGELSDITPTTNQADEQIKRIIEIFVDRVITSIRDGWPTNPTVYEQLLVPVHTFLSKMGVYTLSPKIGEAMDYDIMEPINSSENMTEKDDLEGTMKEIQLYPYMYNHDNLPFIIGKAIVWRKG